MSTEHIKSIKVSEDTYELLTEIGNYKGSTDEIIYWIAETYHNATTVVENESESEKEKRI